MNREMLTPAKVAEIFEKDFHRHYQLNDEGHREEHFRQVARDGIAINEALDLKQDPVLITIAAWVHDLFAWDRKEHQEISAQWVMATEHPIVEALSTDERVMVAIACREHRASYQGDYSFTLSEVVASADRGFADTQEIFHRAFKYATDRKGLDEIEALKVTVEHLEEKFGRDGYMRMPEIYTKFFKEKLERRYRDIEKLPYLSLHQLRYYGKR